MSTGIGTLLFIAPEIMTESEYTYKVDVFSYSFIAYQIITSKDIIPKGEKPLHFSYNIPNGKRPDISMITNQHQIDFLQKCWSNDPKNRPTFSEIINVLKDEEFFSSFDVNINEVNKYLALFPDQSPIKKKNSINDLLHDGQKFTLETILEFDDLISEIESGYVYTENYFCKKYMSEKIIDFLIKNKSPHAHQKIISLSRFLISLIFPNTLPSMEYAVEKLENNNYAIATFSKMLTIKMKKHKYDVYHFCAFSLIAYNIIIRNINQSCIYYTIKDLLSLDKKKYRIFLCGIYLNQFLAKNLLQKF